MKTVRAIELWLELRLSRALPLQSSCQRQMQIRHTHTRTRATCCWCSSVWPNKSESWAAATATSRHLPMSSQLIIASITAKEQLVCRPDIMKSAKRGDYGGLASNEMFGRLRCECVKLPWRYEKRKQRRSWRIASSIFRCRSFVLETVETDL